MRRPYVAVIAVIITVLVLPIVTNIASLTVPEAWKPHLWWAWPAAVGLAVPVMVAELRRGRRTGDPGDVVADARWLAGLAAAVRTMCTREESHGRLADPCPLPLAWRTVGPPISDHWVNIRGGDGDEPLDLDGTLDDLDALLATRIPAGRLVILGEPGTGKTALLVHFVLARLASRRLGDPVPVLLRMSTWDPHAQDLMAWIRQRLADDYGWRQVGPIGVDTILPLLDGLDEMPADRRRSALLAINRTVSRRRVPLVLTSRIDEYLDAIAAVDSRVLTGAAVVELRHLSAGTACDYLVRATTPDRAHLWTEVFAADRDRAGGRGTVAAALATPLALALARLAYADGHADPARLLDLPDEETIRDHLLDQFVPSVYPDPPHPDPDAPPWTRAEAQTWLSFLAGQLVRRGTHDICWWELRDTVPRAAIGLAGGVLATLAGGLCGLWGGPWAGLGSGLAFGAMGLMLALGVRPRPKRFTFRIRHSERGLVRRLLGRRVLPGWLAALGLPVLVGLVLAVLGVPSAAIRALLTNVVGPLSVVLLVVALLAEFSTMSDDADVRHVPDPMRSLRDDRAWALRMGVGNGIAIGMSFGLGFGLLLSHAGHPDLGLKFGTGLALIGAVLGPVTANLSSAWGQSVLARTWLALTGRAPRRLMAFLRDAHRRGVLRQAGGAYQFRHALLRDRLSDRRR